MIAGHPGKVAIASGSYEHATDPTVSGAARVPDRRRGDLRQGGTNAGHQDATRWRGDGSDGRQGPVDHLQDALEDLDKAREKAGEEVSARIDFARERINEARDDLSDRGQEQLKDWREQVGAAADDVLRELGRWTIHAQRSPKALGELADEISKRGAKIGT